MQQLKNDIDFLEQTLLKVQSSNLHDQLEGYQMLKDQISHMQKRNTTPATLDSEGRAVLEGIAYKIMYFYNDTITLTRCQ